MPGPIAGGPRVTIDLEWMSLASQSNKCPTRWGVIQVLGFVVAIVTEVYEFR